MKKIIDIYLYISLLAILFLGIYYLYCVMRPYTIVTYNTPTVMTKDSYEVGEQMTYIVDYCKYYNIPATVYRSLVDGVVYNLNSTTANIATGCHKTIMSAGKVPDVAKGEYHLHLKLVFTPNHFRDVVYEYDTNSFEIINPNEKE